jgi:nucleoside-diphosphate-sugar epimerase
MKIAITGATGFLGRYILKQLIQEGHFCRCWKRLTSDLTGFEDLGGKVEWVEGDLANQRSYQKLIRGMDGVVHAALARPKGLHFRESPGGNLMEFLNLNLWGSISLMNASKEIGIERFIFISTCAVHEVILEGRSLDETHPLWPLTHYGAYKAAVEKFVHSYGLGDQWNVCALRPTGIYGLAYPPEESKWFNLLRRVKKGGRISVAKGGKEVHAADVAKAVALLLKSEGAAGQAYNCYDMYIAHQEVARIAAEIMNSQCSIEDINQGPKNQISTQKIKSLGMTFGGKELLKKTLEEMVKLI